MNVSTTLVWNGIWWQTVIFINEASVRDGDLLKSCDANVNVFRARSMTGSIQLLLLLFSFCSGQTSQKTSGAPSSSILVRDPKKYPVCVSDEDCESISEKETRLKYTHSPETFLFKISSLSLSLLINLLLVSGCIFDDCLCRSKTVMCVSNTCAIPTQAETRAIH